jgi:hypothetical protein
MLIVVFSLDDLSGLLNRCGQSRRNENRTRRPPTSSPLVVVFRRRRRRTKMPADCLAQIAVKRDTNAPGRSVVQKPTDVLMAAVPTEALAAYTAVVGVVIASNIGSAYAQFRWAAYGTFVALAVLAPLVYFKRRSAATGKDCRKLPVPECLMAGAAAAAWGLVMPGSPLVMVYKGNALVFATTAILVGAAALVALASQRLGTANTKNPSKASGAEVISLPGNKPAPRPPDDTDGDVSAAQNS